MPWHWSHFDAGDFNSLDPRAQRHTVFRDLTGHIREPISSNADGWAEWRCPGGSVSVWVEEEALAEMGVQL